MRSGPATWILAFWRGNECRGGALGQEKFSPAKSMRHAGKWLPFPEGFFYALFMNDFLEHVRDPIAYCISPPAPEPGDT